MQSLTCGLKKNPKKTTVTLLANSFEVKENFVFVVFQAYLSCFPVFLFCL